jgi:hypothetical protein
MDRMRCRHRSGCVLAWATLVVVGALMASACENRADDATTSATTAVSTWIATTTTTSTSTTSTTTTTTTTSTTSTSTTSTTSTVPATTTTTQPAWWRAVTPEAPLRVWVVGDSLAGPLGSALASRERATGLVIVTVDFQGGSGLVRHDLYDWPGQVRQRLAEVGPEVVVSLLGANDGQAFRLAAAWVEYGSPEWDREYAARVGGFMDLLIGGSDRVYWVGVPIMAGAGYDGRVQHINAIQQEQAAARGQVTYVDGYSLFQNEAGQYAAQLVDDNGDLVTMRQSDGIHLTAAGADRLALAVLRRVAADWGFAASLGG